MTGKCPVCHHRDVAAINAMLLVDGTHAAAHEYGFDLATMKRHRKHRRPVPKRKTTRAKTEAQKALEERLKRGEQVLEQLVKKYQDGGEGPG